MLRSLHGPNSGGFTISVCALKSVVASSCTYCLRSTREKGRSWTTNVGHEEHSCAKVGQEEYPCAKDAYE
jgi:hypothetical protein